MADAQMIGGKVRAFSEQTHLCTRKGIRRRKLLRTCRDGNKRSHIERLVDMEPARFSICSDSPVIIDTIRCIGALLYLTDEQPFADRVERACGDEERIPFLGRYVTHNFKEGIVLDALPKFTL